MDFFAEQRTRTRRSLVLYALFLLIVLLHMLVALGIAVILLTVFTGDIYYWALVLIIVWTLVSFSAGSFFEYRRLKAGGRSIAQRVGAVRLFVDSSHDAWQRSHGVAHQYQSVAAVQYSEQNIRVRHERDFPPVYRRYHEIAQQLALASGLSMPILYVLPNEQGINGFVAGRDTQDMVLVLSQGALDKLSDEGLYGLIGHEYGHILHGDAKFNLQLMVVLAGLQILYDWSDAIGSEESSASSRQRQRFDNMVDRDRPLAQRDIDTQARQLETQTAHFSTHAEWTDYWRSQSSMSGSSRHAPPSALLSMNHRVPRNAWTLVLHGLSFSSMASAQLIKHSFNRERELLADATSIQLTRSPAILETLKAIHQNPLGSRLTDTADINGLSHFFFASSGADLGDVSWFATHPSLSERMNAINTNDYQHFATQVAKEQRLNHQKIKEIYEQRRRGTLGTLKENSLSDKINNISLSALYDQPTEIKKETKNSAHKIIDTAINKNAVDNEVFNNANPVAGADEGLEFIVEKEVIIDGRLQVTPEAIGTLKLLQPWQALLDPDLPTDELIADTDIQQVSLPHYVLNQSHHPLGAQALIEAVLLCHQRRILSTTATYDLTDIWCQLTQNFGTAQKSENKDMHNHNECTSSNIAPNLLKKSKVFAHTIDHKLLTSVASLDRRMDSALIALALKQLRKHDLSESTITELQQHSALSHSNASYQHYQRQLKSRTMLMRYQQGLIALFDSQLTADLTANIDISLNENVNSDVLAIHSSLASSKPARQPAMLSLWQALHLQQLLPILSSVLNNESTSVLNESYEQILETAISAITVQLDPSGQLFKNLDVAEQMLLVILAYRLARSCHSQTLTNFDKSYVMDLRRHTRLLNIDVVAIDDANLQWLLLTAQSLNSMQLLAIITSVPATVTVSSVDHMQHNRPQECDQIAYNSQANNNNYQLWLSTLHTVMLHDTIVSQDEYDCLTLLAERWLGVRQFVD